MIRVLVAEDHTIVREGIKQLIGLAKDMQVAGEAGNGEQLLDTLPHLAPVDVRRSKNGAVEVNVRRRKILSVGHQGSSQHQRQYL